MQIFKKQNHTAVPNIWNKRIVISWRFVSFNIILQKWPLMTKI